ncbi:hypothetical protein ACER0A_006200 [Haloimpatiens sp. FM7315]|uniref:hypothetical protein n=1 Tax=Haloimpatiens sp. FM7315 TaxID=3298609 RepID=UPI003709E479
MELTKTINKLKWKLEFSKYKYWWHFFVGINSKTGEKKSFFIQYYAVNPKESSLNPKFTEPSYAMVRAGTWGEDKAQVSNFYGGDYFNVLDYKEKEIAIGHCIVCDNYLKGDVYLGSNSSKMHKEFMCQSGSFNWNLKKESRYANSLLNNHLNVALKIDEFDTKYSGYIKYNEEEYKVIPEECSGYEYKIYANASFDFWNKVTCLNLENQNGDRKSGSISVLNYCPVVFGKKLSDEVLVNLNLKNDNDKDLNFVYKKSSITKIQCIEKDDVIEFNLEAEDEKSKLEVKFIDKKDNMIRLCYKEIEEFQGSKGTLNSGKAKGFVKVFEKQEDKVVLKYNYLGKMCNLQYYKSK